MKWNFPTPKQRGKPGRPKKTLSEMAEEFGIPMLQLSSHMRHTKVPLPKCKRYTPNVAWSGGTYVDPVEFRAWWKAHNEAREKEAA